jgi:hypothetical protein
MKLCGFSSFFTGENAEGWESTSRDLILHFDLHPSSSGI